VWGGGADAIPPFQSAFTNACPMMAILRKAGFRDSASPAPVGIPKDLPARS